MPQSSDYLRAKFMVNGDDGIARCRAIIEEAGGRIENPGIIWFYYPVIPHDVAELVDAINYLVDEWDYQSKGFTIGPPVFLKEITKELK